MGSVVADMKERVERNIKLPPTYSIAWSGEFENQERAMQRLAVVVPISLPLIFVLLFDAFSSFKTAAVLNGVVMLTVFQQLRSAGHSVVEAVRIGSLQRLRTVLMTALLAAFGLLPMALSHEIGSETQRPLAIVVIGGLVTATLLTLVVLPALYVAFFSRSENAKAAAA